MPSIRSTLSLAPRHHHHFTHQRDQSESSSQRSKSSSKKNIVSTVSNSLDDYLVFEQKPINNNMEDSTKDDTTNNNFDRRKSSMFSLPPLRLPSQKLNMASMASVTARAHHHHKVCVFDVNTGDIQISNNRDVDRSRLVTKLYQQMRNNESLKKQFSQVASQLPLARRKELASETLMRFHENKQQAMLARKMLPDNVSRHRANILKHLEIDRCFGDLSKDTSELSSVRISSAAVDALLYHEAQKVADAQLKQQRALILPEGSRPCDVLEMRLDAWRRQNVPFAPRTMVS